MSGWSPASDPLYASPPAMLPKVQLEDAPPQGPPLSQPENPSRLE